MIKKSASFFDVVIFVVKKVGGKNEGWEECWRLHIICNDSYVFAAAKQQTTKRLLKKVDDFGKAKTASITSTATFLEALKTN